MTDTELKHWQTLHVRHCRGEKLTDAERSVYDAGLHELHSTEKINFDFAGLRKLRDTLKTMEAERRALQAQYDEVQKEIEILEKALSERARKELGVEL
jgi:predicted RNase H-like nuclease (RuvC/YqgF family)